MKKNFTKVIYGLLIAFAGSLSNSSAQQIQWARPFNVSSGAQGSPSIYMTSVCTDIKGNSYFVGDFRGIVNFNPGGTTTSETSNGLYDGFLAKYDKNGILKFMGHISGYAMSVRKIITDNMGHLYVVGDFNSTTDFDPGAGTYNLTPTSTDGFLAKYDTLGNFIYAKAIGDYITDVSTDASGSNVFVVGAFSGTQDFDPGAGTVNLPVYGDNDLFFARLTASGDLVYAKSIGSVSSDYGSSANQKIVAGSNGEVYLAGSFNTSIDFDTDPGVAQVFVPSALSIYLIHYDQSGSLSNMKFIGTDCSSKVSDIVRDKEGNFYLTGNFCGTLDFDPSGGTAELTTTGGQDVFFAKYNSSLGYVMAKNFGGSNTDNGNTISVDSIGFINISGTVYTSSDFDPSSSSATFAGAANSTNFFLSRYYANGDYYNHHVIPAHESATQMVSDKNGNLYFTGRLSQTADFDFGTGVVELTSTATWDGFIAKYTYLPLVEVKNNSSVINSGANFDFGSFDPGVSSSEVTLTVENSGDWYLKLTDASKVTVSGTDAADFSVNVATLSDSILPEESSSFKIQFTPSSSGAKTAILTIANSDPASSNYTITLQGSGNGTTGIKDASINGINVYPNPSNDGHFIVNSSERIVETIVVNSLGQREIFSGNIVDTQMKGILTLIIKTADNLYQEKLVVR